MNCLLYFDLRPLGLEHKFETIRKDDVLFVIEARKMETTVSSAIAGTIKKIHLKYGELVEQDDLVVEMG